MVSVSGVQKLSLRPVSVVSLRPRPVFVASVASVEFASVVVSRLRSPKSVLTPAFETMRRAAVANKCERIAERLAALQSGAGRQNGRVRKGRVAFVA
jgi:hypothetical protein